jgi:hypothetical protein
MKTLAFYLMIFGNPYDSPTRNDDTHSVPMRADATFSAGRIVCVDGEGYAAEAADAAGLIVLGRCREAVDAAGLNDGEGRCVFDVGVFAYTNSAAHPVLPHHYGRPVFIEDDVTIRATPGANNVFAGFARGFTGSQVWVDMRPLPMIAAWFGNHAQANFRISTNASGVPVFQLWNQDRVRWQTVQLRGVSGAERLIVQA